ncbi:hypothetical protein HY480_00940 [Candidatus Uhrbacteria bacterium]|nr:hypothetical protein [Candidatus Uhrbacteria bacterium]
MSIDDVRQYGCPHCGFLYTGLRRWMGVLVSTRCSNCHGTFLVLAAHITASPFPYDCGDGTVIHPVRSPHPHAGIPAHGLPDERPAGGGEYFVTRSLGVRDTNGCFVCGGTPRTRHAMTALVQCRESGERIVDMLTRGALLEPLPHEPLCMMVVIGACTQHQPNLDDLHVSTHADGGTITAEMIACARDA